MKFIIYTDKQEKVRWKLLAKNGRTVADSGEGYNGVGNARRAIKAWLGQVEGAKIEVAPKPTEAES